MKRSILFIINPISGGKSKKHIPSLIEKGLSLDTFTPSYVFTDYAGHATEIALQALKGDVDIVVAVGGDGTINEVASAVVQGDKILGIIPFGSGNGLARFLKIPLKVREAVAVINNLKIEKIDTARLNEHRFFNMAGVGFDAHISKLFAGNKKRGFITYIKLGVAEILNYQSQRYKIKMDGLEYHHLAFAISVANSSQYGNNVHIAPQASITDGWLDVCIIKPLKWYQLPWFAFQIFTKMAVKTGRLEIIKAKKIEISLPKPAAVHLDGEPFDIGTDINIEIKERSLSVLIP